MTSLEQTCHIQHRQRSKVDRRAGSVAIVEIENWSTPTGNLARGQSSILVLLIGTGLEGLETSLLLPCLGVPPVEIHVTCVSLCSIARNDTVVSRARHNG